jgi:hypothetical protein
VYQEDPKKAPKIVFVMKGIFQGNNSEANINYPMIMIGAGQNKTILSGYSLIIKGTKEKGKRVVLKGLTTMNSMTNGLYSNNGLSFLCDSMTFTQCGSHGVSAWETKGRLINCVIAQCAWGGIWNGKNALIELEGSQTRVDGNNTDWEHNSIHYGLYARDESSIIHLLYPLTK